MAAQGAARLDEISEIPHVIDSSFRIHDVIQAELTCPELTQLRLDVKPSMKLNRICD